MSFGNLEIRSGFNDFFQPFSATVLPTRTSIEQKSNHKFGGGYWVVKTDYEIHIYTKRLQRDNVDVQLGNVEREIQKMCCLYTPQQIVGIEDMTYFGQERIYGASDDYAKSNWETRILISIQYKIVNNDAL